MALIDFFTQPNSFGSVGNVNIIMPANTDTNLLGNTIASVIGSYHNVGISTPPHSVFIMPAEYSSQNERPFSTFQPATVFLFPYANPAELIFQYLHELCHHIVGSFLPDKFWIAELLCSTSALWFFPGQQYPDYGNNLSARFFLNYATNKANYQYIKATLPANPSNVYLAQTHIGSALLAYWYENKNFNFVELLRQYALAKDNPSKQEPLNNYVISILEGTAK